MDKLSQYTDYQFLQKFEIAIEDLTRNKKVESQPVAYLLGGQPGAGKSSLHRLIKNQNKNIIIIDNDTFKYEHPNYQLLEQKYGKDVVEYVTPFSNQMTEKIIDYLSDKGFNLIIEGTLRTSEVPMNTANQLKDKGYEINLYVMAVPKIESYLGTLSRYEDQFILSPKTARATTQEAHDRVVNNLPENLEILYQNKVFKDISLYDRSGKKLYSSFESSNLSPKRIIKEELNKKVDNNKLLKNITTVLDKMNFNQHTNTKQYKEISELSTRIRKDLSNEVQKSLKEFTQKNPDIKQHKKR